MKKTRPQIALTFGKRILIVLVILAAMIIGILKFAENSSGPLRLGLQDYLSRTSGGHPAEITSLEKSALFPQVEFILKDIVIRDKANKTKTLVAADQAHIAMSFWK